MSAIPAPPETAAVSLEAALKKANEEDALQSLDQQENMKISGSNARHMVMQKLMRQSPVGGVFPCDLRANPARLKSREIGYLLRLTEMELEL